MPRALRRLRWRETVNCYEDSYVFSTSWTPTGFRLWIKHTAESEARLLVWGPRGWRRLDRVPVPLHLRPFSLWGCFTMCLLSPLGAAWMPLWLVWKACRGVCEL